MSRLKGEKLFSPGESLISAKQKVQNWGGWRGVDLGDLFEHVHTAAEALFEDDVAKKIFIALSKAGPSLLSAEDVAEQLKRKAQSQSLDAQSVSNFFSKLRRAGKGALPGIFVEECRGNEANDRSSNGAQTCAWSLAPSCTWHLTTAQVLREQGLSILREHQCCTLQELVQKLEEDGSMVLQPFGDLKQDIVLLALAQNVHLDGNKVTLREDSARRRPGTGTTKATKSKAKARNVSGVASTAAERSSGQANGVRSTKSAAPGLRAPKGNFSNNPATMENGRQASKSSKPSTIAVNVDQSLTNGAAMAARLRETAGGVPRCDSTARMQVASGWALPEQALIDAADIGNDMSTDAGDDIIVDIGSGATTSGRIPAKAALGKAGSSKRSQSEPYRDEEEHAAQQEALAVERSVRSDHGMRYLNEHNNSVWQAIAQSAGGKAGAAPASPAAGHDTAESPLQPREPRAEPTGAEGAPEDPSVADASAPEQPAAGKAASEGHTEVVEVRDASGLHVQVYTEGPAGEEVWQKLQAMLALDGKQHLVALAAGWAIGRDENKYGRVWFRPPGVKKTSGLLKAYSQAIEYLEQKHAEGGSAARLCGAAVAAEQQEWPRQGSPMRPAEVDRHSGLGLASSLAARQHPELTSTLRAKTQHGAEEVETSPAALSPPSTPRERPKRAEHKVELYNPSPPSGEEKRRLNEELRMKERQRFEERLAEKGLLAAKLLRGTAAAEQLPAVAEELPAVAAGNAPPAAAGAALVLRGGGRGKQAGGRRRGRPPGGRRDSGRGRGLAVRSRNRPTAPPKAAAPAGEDPAAPGADAAEAGAQAEHDRGGGVASPKRKRALHSADAAAKKPCRGPDAVAGSLMASAEVPASPADAAEPGNCTVPSGDGDQVGRKVKGLLEVLQTKLDGIAFERMTPGKPGMMRPAADTDQDTDPEPESLTDEPPAHTAKKARLRKRVVMPESATEASEFLPSDSEDSAYDTQETDSEGFAAQRSKKKPAAAAKGRGKAAEKGQKTKVAKEKGEVSGRSRSAKRRSNAADGAASALQALAPARQALPQKEEHSIKGHYWLDRPKELLMELPRHKQNFTADQEKLDAKSCHSCMMQHLTHLCRSDNDNCEASYCQKCCELMGYIKDVATDEEWRRYAAGWCPRCLGFCTCRACMRKPHPRAPYTAPAHQAHEFARHVLRYVGPLLADQQRHKEAEVAADARPVAYEKVQRSDPEEFRHLCDRCATSIADLYRTCPACERTGNGFDLCLQCCTDARTSSPGQEIVCNLGHPMKLVRFYDNTTVKAVKQAIEMSSDGEKEMWEWSPELERDPSRAAKSAALTTAATDSKASGKKGAGKRPRRRRADAAADAKPAADSEAAVAAPSLRVRISSAAAAPAAGGQAADLAPAQGDAAAMPAASADRGSEADADVDIVTADDAARPAAPQLLPAHKQDPPKADSDSPRFLTSLTSPWSRLMFGGAAPPQPQPPPDYAAFNEAVQRGIQDPGAVLAGGSAVAPPGVVILKPDQATGPPSAPGGAALRPEQAAITQQPDEQPATPGDPPRKRARHEPVMALARAKPAALVQRKGRAQEVEQFRDVVYEGFPEQSADVAPYLHSMAKRWRAQTAAAAAPPPPPLVLPAAAGPETAAKPARQLEAAPAAAAAALPAAEATIANPGGSTETLATPPGGQLAATVAAAFRKDSRPASLAPLPPRQKWWHQAVPDECKRLAASRPNGWQNYVYTPHADDLAMANPDRKAQVRLFQEVWREGVPVVVRGVRKGYQWDPTTMGRATAENNARFGKDNKIEVIDCGDWRVALMKQQQFFKLYEKNAKEEDMLKLKDWPPNAHFRERLGRHNQDFMEMLPMPEYSHPRGPLNLVSYLKDNSVKPDLGPKSYVAFGRLKEHKGNGDSVTKMHCDLSDAVNIMCHQSGCGRGAIIRCGDTPANPAADPRCSYGGAGAVWDIWPRDSRELLAEFLRRHAHEFDADGLNVDPDNVLHPIHDQDFFLTAKYRAMLKEEFGIESWHFEQHADEAVFIPAGCPHQVRNLRSCIKVAIDFVSPESAQQCLELTAERRVLALVEARAAEARGEQPEAPVDCRHSDKLQAELMVARAAAAALAHLR